MTIEHRPWYYNDANILGRRRRPACRLDECFQDTVNSNGLTSVTPQYITPGCLQLIHHLSSSTFYQRDIPMTQVEFTITSTNML